MVGAVAWLQASTLGSMGVDRRGSAWATSLRMCSNYNVR